MPRSSRRPMPTRRSAHSRVIRGSACCSPTSTCRGRWTAWRSLLHVHATRPDIELIVTSGGQNLKNAQLPDSGTFLPKPYHHQQLLDLARKKLASKG